MVVEADRRRYSLLFGLTINYILWLTTLRYCLDAIFRLNVLLFMLADKFSPSFTVPLTLKSSLRYGENPHQKAAFYTDSSVSEVNGGGIATAIQHHGKVILHCIMHNIHVFFIEAVDFGILQ